MKTIPDHDKAFMDQFFRQIEEEFGLIHPSLEALLRNDLQQVLLNTISSWKQQTFSGVPQPKNCSLNFFDRFTQLVEEHYKQKHTVAEYAGLLSVAPKTLAHKFKRMNLPLPNDVIKNRIILEAEKLLMHTSMTAKEIAYELGYEDPAYFSRSFFIKTGVSPSGFRAKYLMQNNREENKLNTAY